MPVDGDDAADDSALAESFEALGDLTGPSALVPTVEEAARELGAAEKEAPTVITDGRWPRQVAGSPTTVRDQIEQMTKTAGVDEVMVQDMIADPQARAHSRALLAQALGATPGRA